jgi:sulfur carrier protein
MKITVNSQIISIEKNKTIASLLRDQGYKNQFIAIAINSECIPRSTFDKTVLKPEDCVEILAPMAGG